jgi:D-alanyl-lipoteichoic acid acyltransferase DltB (MBOAT superfamily)
LTGKNRKYTNQVAEKRWLPSLKETGQMLLTFFLVVIGWIIFRAESIGQAWEYVCGMCNASIISMPMMYVGTKKSLMLATVMLVLEWLTRRKEHALQYNRRFPSWAAWIFSMLMILLMLEYTGNSQSFIYFQF